jgi:hypothetical protein
MSGTFQTKPELRRQWVRNLGDQDLLTLACEIKVEQRRRRGASADIRSDRGPTDKIRWWRSCPICNSYSCRCQSCRNAERLVAGAPPITRGGRDG